MPKILKNGSKGPEVAVVQRRLKQFIAPELVVDGNFGDKTEAAVRRFQKAAGFNHADIDGRVGPKTTLALFQAFDVRIFGRLKLNLAPPGIPTFKSYQANRTGSGNKSQPTPPAPGPGSPQKIDVPKRFQANTQLGYQQSLRDGPGVQAQLGLTVRSPNYFGKRYTGRFFEGIHFEVMPSLSLGIPLPGSSIYTGQLGVTIQPLTDWLVIQDRWHFLTPSLGTFAQLPFNPSSQKPGMDDPSSHSRVGGSVGLELFHVDIVKDRLAVGISGQESFYWDFKDHNLFWDPSVLGFVQGTLGSW
jgi:hypothetical protein